MSEAIDILRAAVHVYDKLEAENKELRNDIRLIAKELAVSPVCIPSRYLNTANDTMTKVILAVLRDAKINAHHLSNDLGRDEA